MKIAIMSDSHDNQEMIGKALAFFEEQGCEHLIHAGDIIAPFSANRLAKFKGTIHAIYGNNDGEIAGLKTDIPSIVKPPLVLEVGGRSIFVVHDLSPENQSKVDLRSPDVVISGHTHKAGIQEGGTLYINPGEVCGYITGQSTVAVLDTDSLEATIFEIK